ncbi:MAG: hypothetical protein LBC85_11965 [Fibromonadaceae bacterium]|jgi:hypothetical protein|nr:hypothetical protein [Fibromonadaceae bacterium]
MDYKELDDPVEEVYRIRAALLEEHGGFHNYQKYIEETRSKWETMGFRRAELRL